MTQPRHPDVTAVHDAVRAGGLLGDRPVVALVSGGRDSVCLLDVAVALLGPDRVRVLHVDYGLRAEAAQDVEHVTELARRLGVPVEVHSARRPLEARGNLQAWARDIRYARAGELAREHGALVATGHTATDQVETVLYRLASSPGRRALLGMPARQGKLVRPLLGVSREQTAAYCCAQRLPWREDASNAHLAYARNRVRAGLSRALSEIHPAAHENVLRTVALLNDEGAVLDHLVTEALGGATCIDVSRLAALPPALGRLVAARLAEQAAGAPVPAAANRLPELIALGRHGGSAHLDLPHGVRAIAEYGVLRFGGREEQSVPEPIVLDVPGDARFGAWQLTCRPASHDDDKPGRPPLLDADALGPRITIRPWRRGDRMTPAGAGGTRTLSDLFTDRRVPRAHRHTIPVAEAHGQIVWVAGIATAHAVRATEHTRRAVALVARPDAP